MSKILIIDDDTFICNILEKLLKDNGYQVEIAFSALSAEKKLKKSPFDLAIVDFRLPDSDGAKVLEKIKLNSPQTVVIIITAYADVRVAVKLMKLGAYDYVTKPIQPEELLDLLKKSLKKSKAPSTEPFPEDTFIVGSSAKIKNVLKLAETVAPTDLSVLIEGETGSGKEYVARYIHGKSTRANKPFIALDCGAIPKDLANSELFGHIKGSFTGAIKDKTGVFEEANGGTLFLDEIGNLRYDIQIKLLRALQEKKITRVGDARSISVDVRIIAATNEKLQTEVDDSNFREDLYHRLNEFKLFLPPLRERKEDLHFFIDHFIKVANARMNKKVSGIDPRLVKIVENYPWHGNIRELRNVMNRAVLMATEEVITINCLPPDILKAEAEPENILHEHLNEEGNNRLKDASHEFEKVLILNTLRESNFNKSKAARILKIDRKTLYNKIKQYNIEI